MNAVPVSVDEALRSYWESDRTISIIDKNLHALEIDTVLRHLQPTDCLADIGCGDGTATLRYAARVKTVVGIERSNRLRALAAEAAQKADCSNATFRPGDVLDLNDASAHSFDAVVSQRMLINLVSWADQQTALCNLHRILKPGGRLILVENTNDAMLAMNDVRAAVDLEPVPQHWHNRFFDHQQLQEFWPGKFQVLRSYDFGLYYLLTRVFVPMFAHFSGCGVTAVKDPIFAHADASARRLYELLGDRVRIGGCRAFGPIQVFVLRREGPDLAAHT